MNTQSLVTWNYTLSDATEYLLKRTKNSETEWTSVLSCSIDTASYYDNDVWWHDTLWYKVAAINTYGQGGWSDVAEVYIQSPPIDIPLLSGDQGANHATQSVLDWTFTGSTQGSPISFSLQRSNDSGSTWAVMWDIDSTGSAYIDDPLSLDSTASYRIQSSMDFGLNSVWSNIVHVLLTNWPNVPAPILVVLQDPSYSLSGSVDWEYTGSTELAQGFTLERASRSNPLQSLTYETVEIFPSLDVTSSIDLNVSYSNDYYYRIFSFSGSRSSSISSDSMFMYPPPPQIFTWQFGTLTQSVAFWGNFLGQYTTSLFRSVDGGLTWPDTYSVPPTPEGYYYIDNDVSVDSTYTYKLQEQFYPDSEEFSNTLSVTIIPETSSKVILGFMRDAGYQYDTSADTPWNYHTASLLNINSFAKGQLHLTHWLQGGDNYYNADHPGVYGPNTHGGYEGQMGRLLGPTSSFYTVVGNHDVSDAGIDNYRSYFQMFTQSIGVHDFYTASIGPVMIFGLRETSDTGTEFAEGATQWTWFSQSCEDSLNNHPDIIWRVAMVHVPGVISSGSHNANQSLVNLPWKKWGIDAMYSGHVHFVERLESSSVVFINSSLMGSDKRTPTEIVQYDKWWYTGGEEDHDYVWSLLEFDSGSNKYAFSMSFYSGSTKLDDTGSTEIINGMMTGGSIVLMKPWYAPPTASASQVSSDAYVSWIFSGDFSQSLFRSEDSGATWPVTYSIDPEVYEYTDSDVLSETSYWYKVRHLKWPTEPYSNVADVYISTPPTPPEAPLFLEVTSGSAILDWNEISNATYYNIYKSIGGTGSFEFLDTSDTNHYVDHDVIKNNVYWYKVTAVNDDGESDPSNEAYLITLHCEPLDFEPLVYSGVIGYSSGSTYKNIYGKLFPFTTSVDRSISVYARSKDFDSHLALIDSNHNILVEDQWDGWNQTGDYSLYGNTGLRYELSSGSYFIELSTSDNRIGRYILTISPGSRLETSWSIAVDPNNTNYISSSQCIVVGESGLNLVYWNINERSASRIIYTPPEQIVGSTYSPKQDKVYAWCYYYDNGFYSASIDEYDNVGNFIQSNFYYRNPSNNQPYHPTVDLSDGYVSYDAVNDRIILTRYFYSTIENIIIWDCATRTILAAISSSDYQAGNGLGVASYSEVDNHYYVPVTYGIYAGDGLPMIKIDAETFAVSTTTPSVNGISDYISSSNLVMVRKPDGHIGLYDPIKDIITQSISDLPSMGYYEGAGVGDDCANAIIVGIDPSIDMNIPGLAILDKNTFQPQNYLIITSDFTGDPDWNPSGFYGYSHAFCPSDSRVYSALMDIDTNEDRLYSTRISRAKGTWPAPFTASSADTASCLVYVTDFLVTSSTPTTLMERAYPSFITVNSTFKSSSMVISDNEYMETSEYPYQHNRHNWFVSLDGQTRLNDYTESFIHTWPGRNAVVCNSKYYMLSDGLNHQTDAGEPITASSLLIFDISGSLLNTIALTHGGMDLGTDGECVYMFEHDGTDTYMEYITASTDTIRHTYNIINRDWTTSTMFNAEISETASLNTHTGYYQGKMFVVMDINDTALIYCNNLQTGSEFGCGWGDVLNRVFSANAIYYNYSLNMADGTSDYGGWTGGLAYCPLNNSVYVGALSAAPDYAPIILKCNSNLDVNQVFDLSSYTGSNFLSADEIVYNPKNRSIELYCHSNNNSEIIIYDPVANTFVCQKSILTDDPIGFYPGYSVGIDKINGTTYVPQRYDGNVDALTGSVKIYTN